MKTEKTNQSTQDGPAPSNAFIRVLQVHGGGEACNELADALRRAVEAVERVGKPAGFSLDVRVVPAAKGAYGIVMRSPKLKLPEEPRTTSLWYGDEEHNLHRQDPRQKELPLKTVADPAAGEARKVVSA